MQTYIFWILFMSPEKLLDDLVGSATYARAHYQIWWALANRIYPDLATRANEYADFFQATLDAHYTAMFIHIGHIFDKRTDSSSIPTLLTSPDLGLETSAHAAIVSRFNSLAIRAVPVVTARHKTVAHIDAQLTEKQVFASLDVKPDEIRDLIDDCCALIRDLVRMKGLPYAIFESLRYLDATLEVVSALPKRKS